MYQNKAAIDATATANGGANFINDDYWSSTEYNVSAPWLQDFANGQEDATSKSLTFGVRAVRAF